MEKAAAAEPVDVDLLSFIGQGTKPMIIESPEQLDSSEIITLHVVSNEEYLSEAIPKGPISAALKDSKGASKTTAVSAIINASSVPTARRTEDNLQKSEVELKKINNSPSFHNLPIPVPPVFRPWSARPSPYRPRCPHCPAKLRYKKQSCTHDLGFP